MPPPSDPQRQLQDATALVRAELSAVDAMIARRLTSDIVLIRTLASHLINSGGKRLRPLILLLAAKAAGNGDAAAGDDGVNILLATVIEFIHTATLLHDDVVDASAMRRGRATANEVWGNEASVLVGDFLYSRAFEMMVEADDLEVMRILAATTNTIAEGEVMQLLNTRAPDTSEAAYFDAIARKTAKLFQSAAELGALIAGGDAATRAATAEYGLQLGIAFQLTDDVLDYRADSRDLGKNAGDDLAEGKPTLPLIVAMREGDAGQRAAVRAAIENASRENIDEILTIVENTGGLGYTMQRARRCAAAAAEALAPLGESAYKRALAGLAEFAVARGY